MTTKMVKCQSSVFVMKIFLNNRLSILDAFQINLFKRPQKIKFSLLDLNYPETASHIKIHLTAIIFK